MSDKKAPVVSMSGAPIWQHGEPTPFEAPKGEMCLEEISNHIEAHLGKVETVFHEIVSDTVHIDVHIVRPRENAPYVQLVTSGMSDLPMSVPEEFEDLKYAELLMTLPGDWQLSNESFEDERWYWPIRLIKTLARFPHKYQTWLGYGHTMPNGDPPEPYAPDTQLSGMMLAQSAIAPDDFLTLRINDEKLIHFYAVIPLYQEEMDLKLRLGADKLLDKFEAKSINDLVDPSRPNVAKKRFGFF